MITVKPHGGLANRMRVMDSVLLLAKKYSAEISIIWEKSFDLNCSFFKLFEPIPNTTVREFKVSKLVNRTNKLIWKSLKLAGINYPFGYQVYLFNKDIERLKSQHYDFSRVANLKSVYITTFHRFYSEGNLFADFKPVKELQEKINHVCRNFGTYTIGVHIRRKDNLDSIQYSPTEAFIKEMEKEISENNATFYLATDSEDIKKQFINRFGQRIITQTIALTRNTEEGIRNALVDLYCLANTRKILGSYYSSFSEVAAEINKKEYKQIYVSHTS